MELAIPGTHTPCPQCGATLVVPHEGTSFVCPWCRATLQPGDAVPLHYLIERPRLSAEDAERLARSRISASVLPGVRSSRVSVQVDERRFFPFLRVRKEGRDEVVALSPLPRVELLELPRVPADMLALETDRPTESESLDEETLRARLLAASSDPTTRSLSLEYRAYFPVVYSYAGASYSAILPGAGGDLLAEHRPARRGLPGERTISLGALAILFAEAVFVPGLWPRFLAILLTGVGLYPVLSRIADRRG